MIMGFEYEVKSELLRHEICYSLGQMEISKKKKAVVQAFLEKVVSEPSHSDFVKHEAIEALEVFNEDLAMKVLEELKDKQSGIVYETYYLKKKQIEWE